MKVNRRQLISGAAALLAAPAIVKYSSIMKVRDRSGIWTPGQEYTFSCWLKHDNPSYQWIDPNGRTYADNGWFRYSYNFVAHENEHIRLYIPSKHVVYAAQLENPGAGVPFTLELCDTGRKPVTLEEERHVTLRQDFA